MGGARGRFFGVPRAPSPSAKTKTKTEDGGSQTGASDRSDAFSRLSDTNVRMMCLLGLGNGNDDEDNDINVDWQDITGYTKVFVAQGEMLLPRMRGRLDCLPSFIRVYLKSCVVLSKSKNGGKIRCSLDGVSTSSVSHNI